MPLGVEGQPDPQMLIAPAVLIIGVFMLIPMFIALSYSFLTANPYGFSKECAQVYTMQLAPALLSRGVRINSVCPGLIETPLLKDFSNTLGQGVMDWMVSQSGGRRAKNGCANAPATCGSPPADCPNPVKILITPP